MEICKPFTVLCVASVFFFYKFCLRFWMVRVLEDIGRTQDAKLCLMPHKQFNRKKDI